MVRVALFYLLLVSCCGYALSRGGKPERLVAAAYVLCVIISNILVLPPFGTRYSGVEYGVMLTDVALLMLIAGVALFSERYWPLWMTAMQAMTVLAHLGRLLPQVKAWTYWNAVTLWSYPMLLLLVIATSRHRMRLARTGADSS